MKLLTADREGDAPAPSRRRPGTFVYEIAAIAVVGAIARLAFVLIAQAERIPFGADSYVYTATANFLAEGRGWISPLLLPDVIQAADHPPLYIAWLAVASLLDPGSNTSQLTHMLWSSIPGIATIVMCGLAGRELAGPRTGIIAAGFAAAYPNMWIWDGLLLSEGMAIFATTGVLLFALRYRARPSRGRLMVLALWCGLAALSRSELILIIPLILVPLVLRTSSVPIRRRVGQLGAALVVVALAMAPWVLFNWVRLGEPVVQSSSFGRTVAAANCDLTYSGTAIGFKNYSCLTDALDRVERPDMGQTELDRALRRDTQTYVRANLGQVPRVVAVRVGRVLNLYHPTQELRWNAIDVVVASWIAYAGLWSYFGLASLAIVGGVALRRRRALLWPLLMIVGIMLVAVALTFAQTRYRAPAEPALVLLAAVGLDALLQRWPRRRERSPDVSAEMT